MISPRILVRNKFTSAISTWLKKESSRSKSDHKNYSGKLNQRVGAVTCFAVGCGIYLYYTEKVPVIYLSNKSKIEDSYTLYSLDEIRKHNSIENRLWVTYKEGVYDITDFVDQHPGGDVILAAAGSAVDPFWNLYGVHKQQHIFDILEMYRIGNISKDDSKQRMEDIIDPYSDEPERPEWFIVNSEKPFNAEPPLSLLTEKFITPSDIFYVRNHLPVPQIDPEDYELEVCGLGVKETKFSLNDLKTKFPKVSVTATVMCAGNRRSEMSEVKPVKGLNWSAGAVGNAVWSGVRLIDILNYSNFKYCDHIRHVQFEGLDTDMKNVPYAASIPVEKILNPMSDIILAYEMNGKPLPLDHGYPVRVIIPGVVGARNVKWLGRIIMSKEESMSHWQQNDYKGFPPNIDWDTVDFKSSYAIQDLPVISAICEPLNKQRIKLKNGKILVRGYAWSGGGCKVFRIDVTADRGQNWQAAKIIEQEDTKPGRSWSWVLWEAEIHIIDHMQKEVEIWTKAVDSNYNVQPESFKNIWNLRGVINNAYHRIKVQIES